MINELRGRLQDMAGPNIFMNDRYMVKKKKQVTEKKRVAYHEAGHAVMACFYKIPFDYVTISQPQFRNGQAGRLFTANPLKAHKEAIMQNRDQSMSRDQQLCCLTRELLILLAGPVADATITNSKFRFKVTDKGDVGACYMILSALRFTNKEIINVISKLYDEVKELLSADDCWRSVNIVAEVLLQNKRLSYDEVVSIIQKEIGKPDEQNPR